MDDFYVYLTSDNENIFFNNKISNFKNILPVEFDLSGEWLVGLSSISYPYRWLNVFERQKITLETNNSFYQVKFLEPGYYSLRKLIKTLNKIIRTSNKKSPDVFGLTDVNGEFKVIMNFPLLANNARLYVRLSDFLCKMLGFDKTALEDFVEANLIEQGSKGAPDNLQYGKVKDGHYYIAENPYDVRAGLHTLLVYTDIVDFHTVGNIQSQLLNFVEIPNNVTFGEQITIKYYNIHYFPLITNKIKEIEIEIRDDSGESIDFIYGKTYLTLHFKKLI